MTLKLTGHANYETSMQELTAVAYGSKLFLPVNLEKLMIVI